MARAYQVRSFDSLLKSRIKNAQMRQKIYKNLLTLLVQDERVVTTLAKCKDLSRVAERVCIQQNLQFRQTYCNLCPMGYG